MRLIAIPRDGRLDVPGVKLPEAARAVIVETLKMYERRGYDEPWTGYLAIHQNHCVGTCAFTSPPVENTVEIAYFTYPEFENRGMATGMARSLLSIAQGRDPSVRVIAHTLTCENASTNILKKVGFIFSGTVNHPEDGEIWKWSYEPKLGQI